MERQASVCVTLVPRPRSADTILIPAMHFHTRDYNKNMIGRIPEFNQQREWTEKEPRLFGRFRCA